MAAFQRDKIESDCYEFEKYNEEAYRNLDVVKTLVLHGEMDAVLRSCAYEGSRLSDWWQETECDCMPRVLGWNRICKYAIKMYIILNLLHFFPKSWDRDGVPVDDYRNIKAYQLAIRSCTKTGSLGDVAMYPHWNFFGIKKGQFRRNPKPFDVPRWKHFMRLERDRFCFWFHDDDAADDGVGLKAEDEFTERSAHDPNGYYAYALTFYPYGLISYEEFLNFETPVGHQISPSDVTYVRWILCQKGLPVEVSDCILEYADYTPRGSLSLSGKPLHPQCKQELDCYLHYCWQLIVRCYMLGNELKDKMDIEDLLRMEVKDSLAELFSKIWETRDWVDSDRELQNQDVYRLLLDCMPNLREIRVERCKTGFDGTNSYDSDLDDATAATAADEYEDDASCFSGTDSEGLYIGQFGPEEFMYSKEAEWPPELHVAGWTVDIAEEAYIRYVEG
ncbi:hypothetical protein J7337_002179 [Fusarium musae]|uniref:Uncharacterized protein n=1 Tax=Fusarium musae TaxID=1042133 RepID=A0A9P8DNM2_9HYPO|nr:hypothetical protein J7337_002179 [Fusarium musae]KAG9505213.1 hypothetical protein J7337_002179 [Fusarium musae]